MLRTNPAKLSHFNSQAFPRKKPAGAYRIFAVGGSTTYGHPWRDPVSFSGWLRELLPATDPSRKWEVINAGGISYASYRVAKLVEEVVRYQPDLILVYSGHNEFLEERTYRKAAAIPGPLRDLSALLDRTRTYTLMRGALRKARSDGEGAKDEGNSPGGAAGDGRPSLSAEVDDVLARTIGPETYVRETIPCAPPCSTTSVSPWSAWLPSRRVPARAYSSSPPPPTNATVRPSRASPRRPRGRRVAPP